MREAARAEALWFGHEGAANFGMLHQPAAPSTRGVIFCNALGLEGLLANPAFRHLSDDLTGRGFWALRFDYAGEGDSAGGPWEPQRVEAWIAGIDAAVAVLHSRGVTDIRLVGFRIGASLACRYATTHPGISGLVLWSPCARGAAYVRELRALSRLSALARPVQRATADWFPEDSLEVVGFELSAETLQDLSDIDLVAAATPFVPPAVLVIDRDDAPANDELVGKFEALGSRVAHHRMAGYSDFVTSGVESSVMPWPILHRIEDWLDAAPSAPAPADTGGRVDEQATLVVEDPAAGRFVKPGAPSDAVVEETTWINEQLFAIVTRPSGRAPIRRASIVLCNTGLSNRIGPGRLYVGVARYWASLGFTVVRVDLGGSGDSDALDNESDLPHLAPARRDELRNVVAWTRRSTGFDQVVVGGVCSGAFQTFQAANEGLEVDDLLLVNPGTFYFGDGASDDMALTSAHLLQLGFFNGRKWRLALHDREVRRRGIQSVRRLFGKGAASGMRVMVVESTRNLARRAGLPVKDSSVLSRDLEAIIARGVNVLLVFAADESAARYFRTVGGPACAALAEGDGLEIVDIDGGDHTFSPPGSRQHLIDATTKYLERRYSPSVVVDDGAERQPSEAQR